MEIAVAGATGSIGGPVADELERRGHEVRRLSRRSESFPVDLESGVGLDAALATCEVLIDATNGGPAEGDARKVLIDGGQRLLDAAGHAGIGHYVCISIVGIEKVPLPYYRVKVEQEALVESSGLGYSIVRSTQFHTLIADLFGAAKRFPILPGGSAKVQPLDPVEVATVIADVAQGGATGARTTIGGPEILELGELARAWKSSGRGSGLIAPVPLPLKLGRALRSGALTDPDADHRGSVGFEDWAKSG